MIDFGVQDCKRLGYSVGLLVKLPDQENPEGKEVSYEGYRRIDLEPATESVRFRFGGPQKEIVGIGFYEKDHLFWWASVSPQAVSDNSEIIVNLDDIKPY